MHGGSLPKENEPPYMKHLDARNYAQANPEDRGAYKRRYRENDMVEQFDPLVTQDNLMGLQKTNPSIKIPSQQQLDILKQSPEAWRDTVLHYGPYLKQMGAAGQPSGTWGQLGQIGEHLTPDWMKPKPGVNY
jgi:hypothetical protein